MLIIGFIYCFGNQKPRVSASNITTIIFPSFCSGIVRVNGIKVISSFLSYLTLLYILCTQCIRPRAYETFSSHITEK